MKSYLTLFLVLTLFIQCGHDGDSGKKSKQENDTTSQVKPNNVVILLDLSGRIKLKNQSSKDQEIIKNTLNAFENAQKKHAFMASKDKLCLALAYQSSSPYNLYKIGNNPFMIDMESKPGQQMNKPVFDIKKKEFEDAVAKLYQKAEDSPTDGADVWGFFCSDWGNFYQADKKNKVILLTDGYMEFDKEISNSRQKGTFMTGLNKLRNKNNWEKIFDNEDLKLKVCNATIQNTEVLVLEIAPLNKNVNTNEFQILQKFWKVWFDDMKVPSEIFKTDDIGSNINQKIIEFIKK